MFCTARCSIILIWAICEHKYLSLAVVQKGGGGDVKK